MSLPLRPDPTPPPTPDPDPAARPRSFAQRLGLLAILVVLPVMVVAVPSLVVTRIFGQRPRPRTAARPTPADTSSLRRELDHRADGLLPTPAPLTVEPVRVSVRDASHIGPRAEKVRAQAQRLGGSVVEGLAAGDEKHLFIDLPAGAADAFRRAVADNVPVETLAVPGPPPAGAARDQVEVFIRAAAADE